jgi:cytochrome c5
MRAALYVLLTGVFIAAAGTPAVSAPRQNATGFDAAIVDKGKEVFGVACTGCHGANHVSIQRKTAEAWRKSIYTMIGRGAQILPDEIEPLAVFLTAEYGPSSPLPTIRGSAAAAPQPMLPGGEIVIRSCGGCHAVNLIFGSRKSEAAWRTTIRNMRSIGARVGDAEEVALAAWLTRNLGPR